MLSELLVLFNQNVENNEKVVNRTGIHQRNLSTEWNTKNSVPRWNCQGCSVFDSFLLITFLESLVDKSFCKATRILFSGAWFLVSATTSLLVLFLCFCEAFLCIFFIRNVQVPKKIQIKLRYVEVIEFVWLHKSLTVKVTIRLCLLCCLCTGICFLSNIWLNLCIMATQGVFPQPRSLANLCRCN